MANVTKLLKVMLITIIMIFVLLYVIQIVFSTMTTAIPSADRNADSFLQPAWNLIGAQSDSTSNGMIPAVAVIGIIMALVSLIIFAVSGGSNGKKRFRFRR